MSIKQYSSVPWEVFTIDGLFDETTLDAFSEYILQKISSSNNGSELRRFSNDVAFLNAKEFDRKCSQKWWGALKNHLPEVYIDRAGRSWNSDGVVDYVMFSVIKDTQHFSIHTDTGCVFEPTTKRYSRYTILTYLNDDFEGGYTRFYDNQFRHTFDIVPKKGRTLIFDIDLFHSGMQVKKGTKYWIGTELVCKQI